MMYEYWWANVRPLSDKKKMEVRRGIDSAEELYYIEEMKLRMFSCLEEVDIAGILKSRRMWKTKEEYEKLRQLEIEFIPWWSAGYPERLLDISDPPYALYVKGKLPDEKLPSAAIVGARKCSPYGEAQATRYAQELAGRGVQIISGMARGIDGIGQWGALNVRGKTFAVLGCGVDVCYPREHIGLYMDILDHGGGIISELMPGTKPLPGYFPQRNRIISGLSGAVLVMEAREKSGSLITADLALEQGRDVYALPGPVNSALSQGCNRLIKQGAGILLSPGELLEDLAVLGRNKMEKLYENEIKLETKENMVYSCLDFEPKNLDRLIRETKLPVAEVLSVLISLELMGLITEVSKNNYSKII